MYNRQHLKYVKGVIPTTSVTNAGDVLTIASTDTDYSTTALGQHFEMTLNALTGTVYFSPTASTPSSTNAYTLLEGDSIDIKVKDQLYVFGAGTDSEIQAIIWEYIQ